MVADVGLIFQNAGYIRASRMMSEYNMRVFCLFVENIELIYYGLVLVSTIALFGFYLLRLCKN